MKPKAPEVPYGENEEQFNCKDCLPEFDVDTAKTLNGNCYEIRHRWPRFSGECTTCGYSGIRYASYEHYLMGDW